MTCRALGVFVLWVTLIQLGCFAWHKLHKQQGMQQLGVHCRLLTTNNTGKGSQKCLLHRNLNHVDTANLRYRCSDSAGKHVGDTHVLYAAAHVQPHTALIVLQTLLPCRVYWMACAGGDSGSQGCFTFHAPQ
jgi:hypothetical protein